MGMTTTNTRRAAPARPSAKGAQAMTATTRTIAGHQITLEPGRHYVATRKMASTRRAEYPISIYRIERFWDRSIPADFVVPGLTYDEANQFLSEFNCNGSTTHDGRIWA